MLDLALKFDVNFFLGHLLSWVNQKLVSLDPHEITLDFNHFISTCDTVLCDPHEIT